MSHQPKPFPNLTEAQFAELSDFFAQCTKLPRPPIELVMARMSQMREMGLEDIPTIRGVSSSMRQYVWTTLGMEMVRGGGRPDKPVAFLTLDAAMLARADALEARYGVRPVHILFHLAAEARRRGDVAKAVEMERLGMAGQLDGRSTQLR